jgi:transcriptional regulator with XRE-family HTH domain
MEGLPSVTSPGLPAVLTQLIRRSGKTQREIARELGYSKPNMISMMKTGEVNIPLQKIGPLAKALEADPAHLMRLALQEYQPENWEAIEAHLGPLLTANEQKVVDVFREVTGGSDPDLSPATMDRLRECLHVTLAGKPGGEG